MVQKGLNCGEFLRKYINFGVVLIFLTEMYLGRFLCKKLPLLAFSLLARVFAEAVIGKVTRSLSTILKIARSFK